MYGFAELSFKKLPRQHVNKTGYLKNYRVFRGDRICLPSATVVFFEFLQKVCCQTIQWIATSIETRLTTTITIVESRYNKLSHFNGPLQ